MEKSIIAVVEDNADNRLLLHAFLDSEYDLVDYMNGTEALSGLRASSADLVLLDISLPGMDGVEVLRRMRTDPFLKEVPVVALTAHAMAGDRERFLAAGFSDYVAKPIVDEKVLLRAVKRGLRRSVGSTFTAAVAAA
jgi:CheY-like chemotaxis protein